MVADQTEEILPKNAIPFPIRGLVTTESQKDKITIHGTVNHDFKNTLFQLNGKNLKLVVLPKIKSDEKNNSCRYFITICICL